MSNLMEKFFGGGGSPGARSGGLTLMDRFMNPMTQGGLAMLGGNDPIQASAYASDYQDRQRKRQITEELGRGITDPQERAMLMMAPDAYVAAKMGKKSGNWKMSDGVMYNTETGMTKNDSGNPKFDPDSTAGKEIEDLQELTDKFGPDHEMTKRYAASMDMSEKAAAQTMVDKALGLVKNETGPIDSSLKRIEDARNFLSAQKGPMDYFGLISAIRSVEDNTVHQGEFDTLEAAGGLSSQLTGLLNKWDPQQTGQIGIEHRKALFEAMDALEGTLKKGRREVETYYRSQYAEKLIPEKYRNLIVRSTPYEKSSGGFTPELTPTAGDKTVAKIKEAASSFMGESNSSKPIQARKPDGSPVTVRIVNGEVVFEGDE